MKKLITILLILVGMSAFGQTPSQTFNGLLYQYNNGHYIKGSAFIPRDTLPWTGSMGDSGRIAYKNGVFYGRDGVKWNKLPQGDFVPRDSFPYVNVRWFGAKGDSINDDTQEIQEAINYVFAAGGGTVYFPNGKYLINGGLQTNISGANPNSQLYIPPSQFFEGRVNIKLIGETSPNTDIGAVVTWPVLQNGAILISNISGSGSYPSILGGASSSGPFGNFTYTRVTIDNMAFRVKANTSASGPTMSAINASLWSQCDISNVRCDVDVDPTSTVLPVEETFGIWMPKQSNDVDCYLNKAFVYGYKYGYVLGEHSQLDMTQAQACKFGYVFLTNGHTAFLKRVSAQWCNYAIGVANSTDLFTDFDGQAFFSALQLTVEGYFDPPTPQKWYAQIKSIYDIDNNGRSMINYQMGIAGGAGTFTERLTKEGGESITLIPIPRVGDRIVHYNTAATNDEYAVYATMQHVHRDTINTAAFGGNLYEKKFDPLINWKDNSLYGSGRLKFNLGRYNANSYADVEFSNPSNSTIFRAIRFGQDSTSINKAYTTVFDQFNVLGSATIKSEAALYSLVAGGTGTTNWLAIGVDNNGNASLSGFDAALSSTRHITLNPFGSNVAVGSSVTPTSRLDITGATGYNQFRLRTQYTPSSSADSNGNTGDVSVDDNFFYYKTSTGWKRSALTTF